MFFCDKHYVLAIAGALLLWVILSWLNNLTFSMHWVVASPLLFLSLIMLQPLLEEMVFRGLLQGWLIQQSWGKGAVVGITRANITVTLLFVSMHLFYHPPLMALAVVIPSLLFGYFRDRYDGWLLPSIFLHIYYNVGYFMLYNPITGTN
ncbi:MAG: JDVT-CTERM system glutamic-type intramembrane protease [Mariprofundus sp.]|nr:JDVT-CTERM system glutamic-type intramembrane protease [Mariprofundus sp.]